MFITAKAFFDDRTPHNNRLLIRGQSDAPREWLKLFRKNVVAVTPKKTGALRRSIITQALGTTASISWRSPYALPQNEGGHTAKSTHFVPLGKNRGFIAQAGKRYSYSNYTTPGTGPRFGSIAFQKTNAEMPAVLRQLGLTK